MEHEYTLEGVQSPPCISLTDLAEVPLWRVFNHGESRRANGPRYVACRLLLSSLPPSLQSCVDICCGAAFELGERGWGDAELETPEEVFKGVRILQDTSFSVPGVNVYGTPWLPLTPSRQRQPLGHPRRVIGF